MDNTKQILIVEDDVLIASALQKKLTIEGFSARMAENGEEGLHKAFTDHPDIILLDIVMPVMDGITMLRKLRENEWGRTVPVLILTNLAEIKILDETKKNSVADYLIKSDWSLEDLVRKIRVQLQ